MTAKSIRMTFYLLAAASFIGGIVAAGAIGSGESSISNPSLALGIVAALVLIVPMVLVVVGTISTRR